VFFKQQQRYRVSGKTLLDASARGRGVNRGRAHSLGVVFSSNYAIENPNAFDHCAAARATRPSSARESVCDSRRALGVTIKSGVAVRWRVLWCESYARFQLTINKYCRRPHTLFTNEFGAVRLGNAYPYRPPHPASYHCDRESTRSP
jgi:hypothetical protein